MEDFYDSDEEIAWGRYTIREAKRDITKGIARKINRRHTFGGVVRQEDINKRTTIQKTEETQEATAASSEEMNPNSNASGTSSEYCTADESHSHNPTSGVENNPTFEVENNPTSGIDLLRQLRELIERPSSPLCCGVRTQLTVPRESMDNLLKKSSQKVRESRLLDNIEQSLVDNTIIVSSDDEDLKLSCVKEEDVSFDRPLQRSVSRGTKLTRQEAIEINSFSSSVISSEAEVCFEDSLEVKSVDLEAAGKDIFGGYVKGHLKKDLDVFSSFNSTSGNPAIDSIISRLSEHLRLQNHEDSYAGINCDTSFKYAEDKDSLEDVGASDSNKKGFGNDSDYSSIEPSGKSSNLDVKYFEKEDLNTSSIDADVSSELDVDHLENVEVKPGNNSAESYHIPEIHIESYSSNQDNVSFDDTLEEINMALKFGLNYKMPGDSSDDGVVGSSNPVTKGANKMPWDSSDDGVVDSLNLVAKGASYAKEKEELSSPNSSFKSTDSNGKSSIPKLVKSTKTLKAGSLPREPILKPSPSLKSPKTPVAKPPQDNFKVPNKPPRCKLTPAKSPLMNKYKNIMSPVGIYIKNSPSAVLKQNVIAKDLPYVKVEKVSDNRVLGSIENTEIPEVIYKPAKTKILYKEKEVVLPKSIKKYVGEPTVIKHEGHVREKKVDSEVLRRKLLQEDLTCASIEDSVLNELGGDVSILTEKQAFRE